MATDQRERGKLNLNAKAVHPAWYLPTTSTPNSKKWAGPYWRDCWVVRAAGSNAALWQLLYLGAGNGNGTPRVSSDQTDLRIKCLAWATFRNRTRGCSILWGQNGSVNSDDEESRFTARKLNSFVERSSVVKLHNQTMPYAVKIMKSRNWQVGKVKVENPSSPSVFWAPNLSGDLDKGSWRSLLCCWSLPSILKIHNQWAIQHQQLPQSTKPITRVVHVRLSRP